MFYAPNFGAANWSATSGFSSNTPYVGSLDGITPFNLLSNPFPDGLLPAPGSRGGLASFFGQTVQFTDRHFGTPTSAGWNLQVQRELPSKTLLAVGYVGERAWALYEGRQFNQLPDTTLTLGNALLTLVPNPFFGQITTGSLGQPKVAQSQLLRPFPQFLGVGTNLSTWGASTYHALQITAERRLAHGVGFTASYTWSKLLDNTTGNFSGQPLSGTGFQDNNNLAAEWAVSSLDVPHRLVVGYTWELPIGAGRSFLRTGWASKLFGGWQMGGISTFQTGETLGVTDSKNTTFSSGGNQRPNWDGTNPAISNPTIDEWFNTRAFSQPLSFTFGTAPRTFGSLHAESMKNFDWSMIKNTQVTDRATFQFRAEVFNLFNRPQFGPPNTNFGTPNFGTVNSQLNNARIIQFALKLLF